MELTIKKCSLFELEKLTGIVPRDSWYKKRANKDVYYIEDIEEGIKIAFSQLAEAKKYLRRKDEKQVNIFLRISFIKIMKHFGIKYMIIGQRKKRAYFYKNYSFEKTTNYLKEGAKTFTREELEGIIDFDKLKPNVFYRLAEVARLC